MIRHPREKFIKVIFVFDGIIENVLPRGLQVAFIADDAFVVAPLPDFCTWSAAKLVETSGNGGFVMPHDNAQRPRKRRPEFTNRECWIEVGWVVFEVENDVSVFWHDDEFVQFQMLGMRLFRDAEQHVNGKFVVFGSIEERFTLVCDNRDEVVARRAIVPPFEANGVTVMVEG